MVTLLHNAGHSIAYKDILKIDTSLAQKTIESMSKENGGVIPPNFEAGRFTHFCIDNIDINDCTINGQNTFHATQMTAWQLGPAPYPVLSELKPSKDTQLNVPEVMDILLPANMH